MAIIKNQAIPPSLIEDYEKVLQSTKLVNVGTRIGRIDPKARRPYPSDDGTPNGKFATQAAKWLRDRWLPNADGSTRSVFYTVRRHEIVNGNFPAQYWEKATATEDVTEYGVPVVSGYEGDYNPFYLDPLRQPSTCKFSDMQRAYPTPPDYGTEADPAPGWEGAVVGTVWRDLYHAQRRVTFSLPIGIAEKDDRPIAIRISIVIEAFATRRGNRNWFALIVKPLFLVAPSVPALAKAAYVRWPKADQYGFDVPGDSPFGWQHAVTRRETRDGRRYAIWTSGGNHNRLALRIATPPSLGFYGSRNDDVRVTHRSVAVVAIAKSP